MPQFNLAWFPSQIFWLIVSFTVLYLMMRYVLLPPVQKIMEERAQKLQAVLRQADEMNAAADQLNQEHDKYIRHAEEMSAHLMQRVHETIANQHAEQEHHLLNVLKASSEKAEKEVNEKHQSILTHIQDITHQFIDILFETVYGLRPQKAALTHVIKERLKEIKK